MWLHFRPCGYALKLSWGKLGQVLERGPISLCLPIVSLGCRKQPFDLATLNILISVGHCIPLQPVLIFNPCQILCFCLVWATLIIFLGYWCGDYYFMLLCSWTTTQGVGWKSPYWLRRRLGVFIYIKTRQIMWPTRTWLFLVRPYWDPSIYSRNLNKVGSTLKIPCKNSLGFAWLVQELSAQEMEMIHGVIKSLFL